MTSPPSHGSSRALRAGAFAASLAVSLVLIELALRGFGVAVGLPEPPPPATIDPYEKNPYIVSYRPSLQQFLPGSRYRAARPSYVVDYEINSHGLRGPEIGAKHETRRLVVLGDSIPEGHGVPFPESFVPRLSDALRGDGWEVVSAAMQGASPIHHAANVRRTLSFDPDAVLLVLYENDLWDDRTKETEYFGLAHRPPPSRSRLWALLKSALAARGRDDTELEAAIRRNRDAPRRASPPDPISPIIVGADVFATQWQMTETYLDSLADSLAQHDVPLVVSVFALGTLVPRMPEAHGLYARNLEAAARRWANRRALPFVSLYPVTESALAELPWEEVMIPDDGHPTTEMHRRLTDRLAPWLRDALPR